MSIYKGSKCSNVCEITVSHPSYTSSITTVLVKCWTKVIHLIHRDIPHNTKTKQRIVSVLVLPYSSSIPPNSHNQDNKQQQQHTHTKCDHYHHHHPQKYRSTTITVGSIWYSLLLWSDSSYAFHGVIRIILRRICLLNHFNPLLDHYFL